MSNHEGQVGIKLDGLRNNISTLTDILKNFIEFSINSMKKNSNIQNYSDHVSVVDNSSKNVVNEDIFEEDDKRVDWDNYDNFEVLICEIFNVSIVGP